MVKSLLNRTPPNHRDFFHVISPLQTPNQDNLANLAPSHHRLLFKPSQGLNLLTSSKVCEPQEVLSAHSTSQELSENSGQETLENDTKWEKKF